LGGVLVLLFVVQLGTGCLLLVHFAGDAGLAFESVRRIMRDVPFGWLLRLAHAHGANWMVALLFAHLVAVIWTGAYKGRASSWLAGCGLLLLTLGAAVTGYILPWSQLSYWATTIVTGSLEYVPVVGHELVRLVRGGERVGPATFRRAFAVHVGLIPLAMLVLVGLHLWLVRRLGLAPPVRRRSADPAPAPGVPLPEFAGRFAVVGAGFLLLLFAGVVLLPDLVLPADSRLPADPLETPAKLKPEWYFLWRYELGRLLPERVALGLQTLALALLVALPWLDRGPARHPLERPWVSAGLVAGLAALLSLTLLGALA
jgi:ubiquinol-cytochrome c reductase cytochrome b subunit